MRISISIFISWFLHIDGMTFQEAEALCHATNLDESFAHASGFLGEDQIKEHPEETVQSKSINVTANKTNVFNKMHLSYDAPLRDDGFGGTLGQGLLEGKWIL